MPLNYGFACSLINFFACVIMLITLLGICLGVFIVSFPVQILKLVGGCMIIAGGVFFIIAAYVLLRVIIQYDKKIS